jgi:hypothetical protein
MKLFHIGPSGRGAAAMGLPGEALTALYIGLIAWIAHAAQVHYILFPELGALSHDVFKRPHGAWARAPVMLALTPLLSGIVGTVLARNFPFGVLAVLLATAAAVVIIALLRSPIAPAISAGVLPISLGITSWLYPASLLIGLVSLALLSLVWRRVAPPPPGVPPASDVADDITEQAPRGYSWLPFFCAFLLAVALLAELTGWRLILFPPLIVIGFEMFAHADVCPWAGRPLTLPLACTLGALAGAGLVTALGATPLAAVCSCAAGIVILRVFRLHVPPAIAVGLLPFVIPVVDYRFPLSVAAGTLLLSAFFLAWRALGKAGWLRF